MTTLDSYRATPQAPLIRFTREPGGNWTVVIVPQDRGRTRPLIGEGTPRP